MPVNTAAHPTYYSWLAMRRCTMAKFNRPPRIVRLYAGIAVCPEWQDFSTFETWAYNNGWQKGLHITRRDKKGDFCPENCFWASLEEANGWRSVVRHLPDGRTIRDVIGRDGLGSDKDRHNNISRRVFCEGWDLTCAVEQPVRRTSPRFHSRKTGEEASLYNAWRNVRKHGAKTGGVAKEWDDYEAFREWAKTSGWVKGMRLVRRDRTMSFSPDNCMWKRKSCD